jgi:hypothetical protein
MKNVLFTLFLFAACVHIKAQNAATINKPKIVSFENNISGLESRKDSNGEELKEPAVSFSKEKKKDQIIRETGGDAKNTKEKKIVAIPAKTETKILKESDRSHQ